MHRPVQRRPRRRDRAARNPEGVRQPERGRGADRDERQGAVGQLPVPVQLRHRAEQGAVVADDDRPPATPPGQGTGELLRGVRKRDLGVRSGVQHVLRDTDGLTVGPAGNRVDDHQ